MTAGSAVEKQRQQSVQQWNRRIERAKFEAQRAARQYHACEPENRLVARTLERRRDELFQEVARLEADGRGGPWAVERSRLWALKACPLVWSNRERLKQLRTPVARG